MIDKGIDCVLIERVKRASLKPRFLERVFTDAEIEYCFRRKNPYKHLSGRFTAKEAFFKAIGKKINWKDIEVVRGDNGAPFFRINPHTEKILGGKRAFLSITCTEKFSVASVLISSH